LGTAVSSEGCGLVIGFRIPPWVLTLLTQALLEMIRCSKHPRRNAELVRRLIGCFKFEDLPCLVAGLQTPQPLVLKLLCYNDFKKLSIAVLLVLLWPS
jgi:hypothetical protein